MSRPWAFSISAVLDHAFLSALGAEYTTMLLSTPMATWVKSPFQAMASILEVMRELAADLPPLDPEALGMVVTVERTDWLSAERAIQERTGGA